MDDNAQHPGSTRVEQKRGLYSLGLVSLGFLENSIFRRHLQDFGSSVKKKILTLKKTIQISKMCVEYD